MIVIVHDSKKVQQLLVHGVEQTPTCSSIAQNLIDLAHQNPSSTLVWIEASLVSYLNVDYISSLPVSTVTWRSFATSKTFLPNGLGYIDQNALLKIPKSVLFQTWQMSTDVGMVSASLIQKITPFIKSNTSFGFFLNSIAQRFILKGLLTYSDPQLLKENYPSINSTGSVTELFVFVRQHYRIKWLFVLFFCFLFFERKCFFIPFLKAFFYSKKQLISSNFDLQLPLSKSINKSTIDVLIPTIGRASYLYDFLKDLTFQTVVPNRVLIVEQHPDQNETTQLNYLHEENWPFEIVFNFTHQTGACHARNLALQQVTAEWVFFADDDIRISSSFIEEALTNLKTYNSTAGMFACLLSNQKQIYNTIHQTTVFGSGCSIVHHSRLSDVKFDMRYEFCYGEDYDFGMQLRNNGGDILYFPQPVIKHLKAPIGGFRTKPILPWQNEPIWPQPSPTILLNYLRYSTIEQQRGYQVVYFLKNVKVKDLLLLFASKRKKWAVSLRWARQFMFS